MNEPRRIVIIGAAGRDFHDFNVLYRNDPSVRVVAFTATQIPDIAGRAYPAELAGPNYPDGIPILDETELTDLITRERVDEAVFAYSDITHENVMHLASESLAAGARFVIPGASETMLSSTKPVLAVTAVRTGAGKSQTTRYIAGLLQEMGLRVVAVRHPMPYGDLAAQAVQRFATVEDLDLHRCTIEEREEYEPYLVNGFVIYSGVDYERILRQAETEADVILWDGGNNDMPFYKPDLHISVADPLRAGDETRYHPGEANLRMADIVIINKCDSATAEQIAAVEDAARRANPGARIMLTESPVTVSDPDAVRGRRVVVVEDGPTLTHGSMSWGAGLVAARAAGAAEIVDPSPSAVGSLADTYRKYPHAVGVLPAMGYSDAQIADLAATIEAADAEVVVSGTPIDLTRVLTVSKPIVQTAYDLREREPGALAEAVSEVLEATMQGVSAGR
ncbi:MAG TPA: cyclic 2,3-diphosphoglycerate synthase [Actinomycetaceae bacterium]|nr:cyclic 2,3-diphosphoglycerate synthase [Actinomycetaceae bacterium]